MNLKKLLVIVSVAALSVFLVGATVAQDNPVPNQRTITVDGYGEASGSPDIAYVQLGVQATGEDVVSTFDDVNTTMQNVLQALRDAGIADEDMQTTGLFIYQESSGMSVDSGRDNTISYRAGNNVNVTIRDISQVGEIISVGVGAGANNLNSLNFGIDDTTSLEQNARAAAVDDARARAAELAELMGVNLGDPLSIVEGSGDSGPVTPIMRAASFAADSVPVQGGQLTVSVQVHITFAIN
ncbi:MAG: SIMPL domain-containing protein [Anaerolineae bacterium]|nr:SIMPL domain-containing protein [Anaerolineae bacterium]